MCVNRTPHRAHLTRATHLVCKWLKMCELCCVLSFLKAFHLIHVSWYVAGCTLFFTILYSISNTCTQSDDCSFVALWPLRVQSLPLRKEGCSLAAWSNSRLSQSSDTVVHAFWEVDATSTHFLQRSSRTCDSGIHALTEKIASQTDLDSWSRRADPRFMEESRL